MKGLSLLLKTVIFALNLRYFVVFFQLNNIWVFSLEFLFRIRFSNELYSFDLGPIQSPQLLMLSGVGPKDHLNAFNITPLIELPVGDNYMSQLNINLNSGLAINLTNPTPELNIQQLRELYFNQSGPLTQPVQQVQYYSTKNNLVKNWPNSYIGWFVYNGEIVPSSALSRPRSRGTVRLQSTSPYIPPKIDPNIFGVPQDLEDFMDGLRFYFFVMERTSLSKYVRPFDFKQYGCPSCRARYTYECDASLRCLSYKNLEVLHYTGSCLMGAVNRSDVVVDPHLRVKHAQNLRVCDSSIFPTAPNTNTCAATLMVGEKCAQFIKDHYNFK